jgi:hypothetical protein
MVVCKDDLQPVFRAIHPRTGCLTESERVNLI